MKVTSSNNPEPNSNSKIETQSPGKAFDSPDMSGLMPTAGTEKSDFAGVLDKVTRAHDESANQNAESSSERQADTHKTSTKDEDKVAADVVASAERPLNREPVSSAEENTGSAPILDNVVLDSIVTACHVQLAANGQQAVTLELSQSMLHGLRVKISSDAAGRITADFLAANEGIKSLLDSRSSELIEQLRSRGINIAEFKSSVAADANDRNNFGREQQATTGGEPIAGGIKPVASHAESTPVTDDSQAKGATYRA